MPRLLLGQGKSRTGRSRRGDLLKPFDGSSEAGIVNEGGNKVWLVKVGRLDDAEEERLEDGVPVLANDGALGDGGPIEECGDGEDDLRDCQSD